MNMNFNKDLFDKTEAKEFGEFETLELGGHEVVILSAMEYTSEQTGNVSLKVCVDIAGNDAQAGFFKKQYDNNALAERKWPIGATRYFSLKDEQIAYLKGLITAVEKSNPGFKFDINGNWEQLKGKKVAGVFGLEEYQDQEGKIKTATRLTQIRSLDKLKEIKIPSVKMIERSFDNDDEYKATYKTNTVEAAKEIFTDVKVDDLPFEI